MNKNIQYLIIGLAVGYMVKRVNTGAVGFDNSDVNTNQTRPETITEGDAVWWNPLTWFGG